MLLHGFTSYFCICLLILRSFPIGPGEMSLPVFVYITVIGGGLLSCFFLSFISGKTVPTSTPGSYAFSV